MSSRVGVLIVVFVLSAACDEQRPRPPDQPAVGRGGGGPFDRMLDKGTDFFLAIAAEQYAPAYDKLCPATRSFVSLGAFTAAVRVNPYLRTASKINRGPGRSASSGGTAIYSIALTAQVGKVACDLYFAEESNDSCISGALIGGTPMLAMPAPSPTAPPT